MEQEGYLFIFISNEKVGQQLWIDDFSLTHHHSPVVQVDDYFPFGLVQSTSYQRPFTSKQRFLYNEGSELIDDLGLNVYSTFYRMLDPALGRWWQIDPKADHENLVSWSPYNSMFNNPIRYNDKNGDCPTCGPSPQAMFNQAMGKLEKMYNSTVNTVSQGASTVSNAVVGAVSSAWNALDKAFSEGGSGSPLTSRNFSNNSTTARTNPDKVDGELNVDLLIGPTLRADPAKTTFESILHGVEMATTIESATGVIESMTKDSGDKVEQKTVEKDSVDMAIEYTVIVGRDTIEKVNIIRVPKGDLCIGPLNSRT